MGDQHAAAGFVLELIEDALAFLVAGAPIDHLDVVPVLAQVGGHRVQGGGERHEHDGVVARLADQLLAHTEAVGGVEVEHVAVFITATAERNLQQFQ
ncbi:hypothetical protein D3C80_1009060 [compost metagenome]